MTLKFLSLQDISIRPQNDTEKIILQNIKSLLISGKNPKINFIDDDMILEIKSDK